MTQREWETASAAALPTALRYPSMADPTGPSLGGPRRTRTKRRRAPALESSTNRIADVGDPRDCDSADPRDPVVSRPAAPRRLAELLPLDDTRLDQRADDLVEEGCAGRRVIWLHGDDRLFYCDADNLEILLRLQRASSRHRLRAAARQRIAGVFRHLATLRPARIGGRTGRNAGSFARLHGRGRCVVERSRRGAPHRQPICGKSTTALAAAGFIMARPWRSASSRSCQCEELGLLDGANSHRHRQRARARISRPNRALQLFSARRRRGNVRPTMFSAALWQAVWAGAVSADSLAVLRAGSPRNYSLTGARRPATAAQRHRSVARRHARSTSQGWPGHWFLLPTDQDDRRRPVDRARNRKRPRSNPARPLRHRVSRDRQSRRRRVPLGSPVPRTARHGAIRRNRRRACSSTDCLDHNSPHPRQSVSCSVPGQSSRSGSTQPILRHRPGWASIGRPRCHIGARATISRFIAASSCWLPKITAAD